MRVDKSKWQKIFLGEVCNLYQPKTIATSCLDSNGKYLVYGANGVIGKYNEYNHKFPEVLITCRGATCGTINISKPFSWIKTLLWEYGKWKYCYCYEWSIRH